MRTRPVFVDFNAPPSVDWSTSSVRALNMAPCRLLLQAERAPGLLLEPPGRGSRVARSVLTRGQDLAP